MHTSTIQIKIAPTRKDSFAFHFVVFCRTILPMRSTPGGDPTLTLVYIYKLDKVGDLDTNIDNTVELGAISR